MTWSSMINDAVTDEVVLFLAVIDQESWAQPIRLVANTEDIVSNGETYTAAAFEIAMPDQIEGQNGQMRFEMIDADGTILALIRETAAVIDVTVSWVLASDPDTVYAGPVPTEIRAVEGSAYVISGALTAYPVLAENAVGHERFRFSHKYWPGII